MKQKIIKAIEKSLNIINASTSIELTPSKGHGDFSTNVALKLSAQMKKSPMEIAFKIKENIQENFIEKIEIAPPGFINFFLKDDIHVNTVKHILSSNQSYGRGNQSQYINVEYVSGNPTGHLHLGHARGAALGSALVNILRFAGNKVDAEYYVNDAGNQIDILGQSTFVRYLQELGMDLVMPEDSYRGQDIVQVAKYLVDKYGDKFKDKEYEQVSEIIKNDAKNYLLQVIKEHLSKYRVHFDIFSLESKLYEEDRINKALDKLKDYTYQKDGALWLKTSSKGDDKDRVLIKANKTFTYLSPDIAYHDLKLSRKYDQLINIWGSDHIGYIKRMKVALSYLGLPEERLDILVVQLVKLLKNNQELKMSKRKGTSYTIEELIEEVGADAARWFMLDRSPNSDVVFNINLATQKNSDNPVFTVQYTHARANQLINKSNKEIHVTSYNKKETEIINLLRKFPDLITGMASSHKVHLLPQYLLEVAREFNSWYSNYKVINQENEGSLIALTKAVKIVIKNGLTLLGISAPEKM